MGRFLGVYAVLYGLLNLYVWRWLRPALDWHRGGDLGFAIFAAAMILLPIATRLAEDADRMPLARGLGFAAYLWMPFLMLIVAIGAATEGLNLLAWAARARLHAPADLRIPARGVLAVAATLYAATCVWGAVEARRVRLVTVVVTSSKLSAGTPPLRLVQVSDLHLGLFTGPRHLERVLRRVEEARPDVLLCTGDFFDSRSRGLEPWAKEFTRIRPPGGKYAVLGNHEYFTGLERSLRLFDTAGFTVLRAQKTLVNAGAVRLCLAGVDDPAGRFLKQPCFTDEEPLLPGPDGVFTVLLKHQPRIAHRAAPPFDLQISGHTHSGQIFPFHALVRLFYAEIRGLHALPGGRWLYVNKGAGTWGPPLRTFAPPEVTLFLIT